MIEIPQNYFKLVSSSLRPNKPVRFEAMTDREKTRLAVERRQRSSRRKPVSNKQRVERRVSSDRRRSNFSQKV